MSKANRILELFKKKEIQISTKIKGDTFYVVVHIHTDNIDINVILQNILKAIKRIPKNMENLQIQFPDLDRTHVNALNDIRSYIRKSLPKEWEGGDSGMGYGPVIMDFHKPFKDEDEDE